MQFELAIFDFDGTLADSSEWFFGSLNEAAERFGFRKTTPEEREVLRHCSNREIVQRLQVPIWKMPVIAGHMRNRATENIGAIRLFDGIPEALMALHERGVKLAVVTSNTEVNVRRLLGEQLASRMAFYGCGSSLFGKAAKLKQAIRRCASKADHTIYIGDEIRDIDAARAVGASSGAVLWGYAAPEALIRSKPTMVFEHVRQLAML